MKGCVSRTRLRLGESVRTLRGSAARADVGRRGRPFCAIRNAARCWRSSSAADLASVRVRDSGLQGPVHAAHTRCRLCPTPAAVFTRSSTAKPACGHSRSLLCGCNPSLTRTGAGSAHSVRAWACALRVCPDVCEVVTSLSLCSVSLVLALPPPPPISSFHPISVSHNATRPRVCYAEHLV